MSTNDFAAGDLVMVINPTDWVSGHDHFRVVDAPEGEDPQRVWAVYEGEPKMGVAATQDGTPLGFDSGDLMKAPHVT